MTTTAPNTPGTYAWVVDDDAVYIGKAKELIQIGKSYGMGRAYNDYTYMPASKVAQLSETSFEVDLVLTDRAAATHGFNVTYRVGDASGSLRDPFNVALCTGSTCPGWVDAAVKP